MRVRLFVALAIGLGAAAAPAAAVTVYVSPRGDDGGDGRAPARPVASLERAEAILSGGGGGTAYLMDGVYPRTGPLTIAGPAQVWTAYRGAHPVLDGGGTASTGLVVAASGTRVSGLAIRRYVNNGIVIDGGGHVTVSGNTITDIAGPAWSQAAISAYQDAPYVTISRNVIARTGYAGIAVFGLVGADVTKPTITDNVVTDTCRRTDDCGAIYVLGRTPTSDGAVIAGNTVTNYGSPTGKISAGIYLDDFLSSATVTRNTVSGIGRYAMLVHGGRLNTITGNVIRVSPGQVPVFYAGHCCQRPSTMDGNVFSGNVTYGATADAFFKIQNARTAPIVRGEVFRP